MAVGRPRAFCVNEALDKAKDVFWRKGYEGASLVDLTTAMGINSPSLYAAFGSKEGLFRAVLDHYDKTRAGFLNEILAAPTARDAAERFLRGGADKATDPDAPPGCLLVQSGLTCGDGTSTLPEEVARHRAGAELTLRERFECAKSSGDLPKDADPAALARYLVAVGNGMCIQASSGATRKDLYQVVDMALAAWPAGDKPAKKAKKPSQAKVEARA